MPKVGYKFTPQQIERLRQSHLGQASWNKGRGGCKRGHDPTLYKKMPSGIFVCLGCKRENGAKYRAKNREVLRLKNRVKRYGIDIEVFEQYWLKQKGMCAICGSSLEGNNFCIDHAHGNGIVRGILCVACNTGIGCLRDSTDIMRNAVRYLNGDSD